MEVMMPVDKVCNYCLDSEHIICCYSNPKDCGKYERIKKQMPADSREKFEQETGFILSGYLQMPDRWFEYSKWLEKNTYPRDVVKQVIDNEIKSARERWCTENGFTMKILKRIKKIFNEMEDKG